MQIDDSDIIKRLRNKKIICFGAGQRGIKLYYTLRMHGIYISDFSDNNKEKWGMFFVGIKCIDPKQIGTDCIVIIANTTCTIEIEKQLKESGIAQYVLDSDVYQEIAKLNDRNISLNDLFNCYNELLYEVQRRGDNE